jgi:hypothetical protein
MSKRRLSKINIFTLTVCSESCINLGLDFLLFNNKRNLGEAKQLFISWISSISGLAKRFLRTRKKLSPHLVT